MSGIRSQLKKFIAVFKDPNSVVVCKELKALVCGTTKLEGWIRSTGQQSGSGRTYHRKLFGIPDRMLWVTGVTCFERAQVLEDWGIVAIRELYSDFRVNKNGSCMSDKHISPEQPNGRYWQATAKQFGRTQETFAILKKNANSWTKRT